MKQIFTERAGIGGNNVPKKTGPLLSEKESLTLMLKQEKQRQKKEDQEFKEKEY